MTNREKILNENPNLYVCTLYLDMYNVQLRDRNEKYHPFDNKTCFIVPLDWWNEEFKDIEELLTINKGLYLRITGKEASDCNLMEFPKTFNEFANNYGFVDDYEVYTNGADLIPVYRVRQWLEHIESEG